jgi:hypothetical protein
MDSHAENLASTQDVAALMSGELVVRQYDAACSKTPARL